MTAASAKLKAASRRPVIRRAILWLLFLAPFFYLTYGMANWMAAHRLHVPNLAFAWESRIPFIAWSILPYWSVNLFYALALFANESTLQVDRLAKRYLTAQVVAVACFIAFPLTVTFAKPETSGLPGFLFDMLGGFDKPFNQVPSLHIALLVIIWDQMRRALRGSVRVVWHVWCLLIGMSVLTTYQHHAVDIPAGALLGVFAIWLFPQNSPLPLYGFRLSANGKARRLGAAYLAGSLLFLALAVQGLASTGYAMGWLWPSLALAIVGWGYFGAGSQVFQKGGNGEVSLASRWLLFPYRLLARFNIRFWTRKLPGYIELSDAVFLGRYPGVREAARFATIVDLSAELVPPRHTGAWQSFACLDLLPPPPETVRCAAGAVEAARATGPVLICCALGFQRSAIVAVDWLVRTGRAVDAHAAEALIRQKGWPVHLHGREDGR